MNSRLTDLIKIQLRIGSLGFGGPLAAIAMMKQEFVENRNLVSREKFLEDLAFVKLLPGPVSTLLSILLGQEILGFWGGLCSGLAYILPSFVMLLLISNFENFVVSLLPQFASFSLAALMAVILGMIVITCYKLFWEAFDHSKKQGTSQAVFCIFIFLLTAFLVFERQNEFLILMGCGLLGILKKRFMDSPTNKLRVSLLPLFLVFFLSSFSVFGTGYMILPVLHKVLVEQYEWLSGEAFLRAVTYGNMTPGPIVISSTYMGYQIAGNAGAWVSTLGMFLPPFCIVLALGPYLKKIFTHRYAQGFVDGVIPAVSASVLVSLLPLAREMGWGGFQMVGLIVGIVLSYRKFSPVKILGLGFVLCFAELIFKK